MTGARVARHHEKAAVLHHKQHETPPFEHLATRIGCGRWRSRVKGALLEFSEGGDLVERTMFPVAVGLTVWRLARQKRSLARPLHLVASERGACRDRLARPPPTMLGEGAQANRRPEKSSFASFRTPSSLFFYVPVSLLTHFRKLVYEMPCVSQLPCLLCGGNLLTIRKPVWSDLVYDSSALTNCCSA